MVSYLCALCLMELTHTKSAGCGMWYRRITQYNDVDPPPPVCQLPLRKYREAVVMFGQTSFSKVIFGPELRDPLSASKKRKWDDGQNDDIILFKRVRVLSKKTRVRRIKQSSGPFTRLARASNDFTETSTNTACENISLKNDSTIPNQSSEMPYEKNNFGPSIADSRPPTFSNALVVPRTDYTASGDDSDDDEDSCAENYSDKEGDDSADNLPETFQGNVPSQPRAQSGFLDAQYNITVEETRTLTPPHSPVSALSRPNSVAALQNNYQ